jgi:hypothetical protein
MIPGKRTPQVTMDFGPLTGQDGWRRLNVAITRARYRSEIVTSIRPGDIPDSVTSKALTHLRRYLTHAAQGLPGVPGRHRCVAEASSELETVTRPPISGQRSFDGHTHAQARRDPGDPAHPRPGQRREDSDSHNVRPRRTYPRSS